MSDKPKLKITLIRSIVGRPEKQRKVTKGLGLKRMQQSVIRDDRPEIQGMIAKIHHLLKVEKIKPGKEDTANDVT